MSHELILHHARWPLRIERRATIELQTGQQLALSLKKWNHTTFAQTIIRCLGFEASFEKPHINRWPWSLATRSRNNNNISKATRKVLKLQSTNPSSLDYDHMVRSQPGQGLLFLHKFETGTELWFVRSQNRSRPSAKLAVDGRRYLFWSILPLSQFCTTMNMTETSFDKSSSNDAKAQTCWQESLSWLHIMFAMSMTISAQKARNHSDQILLHWHSFQHLLFTKFFD